MEKISFIFYRVTQGLIASLTTDVDRAAPPQRPGARHAGGRDGLYAASALSKGIGRPGRSTVIRQHREGDREGVGGWGQGDRARDHSLCEGTEVWVVVTVEQDA